MMKFKFRVLVGFLLVVYTVLVIYISGRTLENPAFCKIPEQYSLDSRQTISTSRMGGNSKTEDTTSTSLANNLFKLYDGVETFVMFIGYPRSSHSLVGAILDAHPEIVIPHEYDILRNWKNYRLSEIKEKNLKKYQLFYELHHLSLRQAIFGIRANNSVLPEYLHYRYHVPGLWQGEYQNRIKVIGDKKGGETARVLMNASKMAILEEINQVVNLPMKFIHVTRNPFDNIATIMLHGVHEREAVREKGGKVNNTELLDMAIGYYFNMAIGNQRVRNRYRDAVLDIPGHETILRPKQALQRLCGHLGVTCSDDYIEKCSRILYGAPSVTRNSVVWTSQQKDRVTKLMKYFPFLEEYSFDEYPN